MDKLNSRQKFDFEALDWVWNIGFVSNIKADRTRYNPSTQLQVGWPKWAEKVTIGIKKWIELMKPNTLRESNSGLCQCSSSAQLQPLPELAEDESVPWKTYVG